MSENLDSGIQEILARGIRNLEHFCLWNTKSCTLESRIQVLESGILKIRPFGIRNPLRWNLESSTRDPESTSWNPESKAGTDYLPWDETKPQK